MAGVREFEVDVQRDEAPPTRYWAHAVAGRTYLAQEGGAPLEVALPAPGDEHDTYVFPLLPGSCRGVAMASGSFELPGPCACRSQPGPRGGDIAVSIFTLGLITPGLDAYVVHALLESHRGPEDAEAAPLRTGPPPFSALEAQVSPDGPLLFEACPSTAARRAPLCLVAEPTRADRAAATAAFLVRRGLPARLDGERVVLQASDEDLRRVGVAVAWQRPERPGCTSSECTPSLESVAISPELSRHVASLRIDDSACALACSSE